MKLFTSWEIRKAWKYALEGGQALHIFTALAGMKAPRVFKKQKVWAHLLDVDTIRLKATAKFLGVRKIFIHKEGKRFQHVDLVGKPLIKAIKKCEPRKIPRRVKRR